MLKSCSAFKNSKVIELKDSRLLQNFEKASKTLRDIQFPPEWFFSQITCF